MNKTAYRNRYGDIITFEHIGNQVIMKGGKWLRYGFSNEDDSIDMVDPSGGPYISIEDNLNEFWPKGKYQDLLIERIEVGDGNEVDGSIVTFTLKQTK